MERLRQAQENLNSNAAQVIGVGAAGSIWVDRLDLGIKVLSAIYFTLLIITMGTKLYKSIRDHFNGSKGSGEP